MNKKEYPGTVAAVHGAEETKAGGNLFAQNSAFSASCQSAAIQRAKVLEQLQCEPRTTLEFRAMGIMHPGMRVCELRKNGHQITTEWTLEYCPGGVRHRVARYRLQPTRQTTLLDMLPWSGGKQVHP